MIATPVVPTLEYFYRFLGLPLVTQRAMLSYDTPVSVNGQTPSSPTNISTARPSIPSSPKASRLGQPVITTTAVNTGVVSSQAIRNGLQAPMDHHIWLVTGPAGCGKSTIAKHLASALDLPYIEGDDFHPKANIDKMSNGIPLTDADRWDWLTALRQESIKQLDAGQNGVVLTCSALKRKYRDVIRVAPYFSRNLYLHFIWLYAPEEVLLKRVTARQNHYMGANMVHSQFDILEPPQADEIDVLSVDVSGATDEVKADALYKVLQKMDDTRHLSERN